MFDSDKNYAFGMLAIMSVIVAGFIGLLIIWFQFRVEITMFFAKILGTAFIVFVVSMFAIQINRAVLAGEKEISQRK